jgi:hypothetical protein
MKRISRLGLALIMGVALAGCSASLSKEDGCKEAAKFASESSSTLNNLTNNIGQQPSQGTFASRLGEIADEASQLNVADSELKKTLEDWSSAQKEIGEFFTDWEIFCFKSEKLPNNLLPFAPAVACRFTTFCISLTAFLLIS